MRRFLLAISWLMLLVAASCSSTTNTSLTGQPVRDQGNQTSGFSVDAEEGSGSFNPTLDIREDADGATVTISAQDGVDVQSAFVHLNYDDSRYTPVSVELGDYLGSDLLSLSLTDVRGEVPVGMVQLPNTGLPANGSGVLATVTFRAEPFNTVRAASKAPDGSLNQVKDLEIIAQGAGYVTLQWTEQNRGDYNNDSEVGLPDLTPMALYLGKQVATTADPIHAGMVDGDKNGEVNLADLTPIGSNYGAQISGYVICTDENGTQQALEVPRPDGVNPKRPVVYVSDCDFTGSENFTVRPTGSSASEVGPVSNAATINIVPGDPEAPTNLATEANATIGAMKIKLSWDPSPSGDVNSYLIERKLSSDPDTSFALIGESDQTTYTDQSGLTDADYDYRVQAKDNEGLFSPFSNTATGHPYVVVLPIPQGVSAQPHPTNSSSIKVNWTAILTGEISGYRVYMKGPGEADFSVVGTYPNSSFNTHTQGSLTEGETYEFYVVSTDLSLNESAKSTTVSSQCSQAVSFEVTGLTTDKITHHNSGSEPASNLKLQCSVAPDSVVWTVDPASAGSVTGTGTDVTWKPSGNPAPTKVTITGAATKGAQNGQASVELIVTNLTIKPHHLDRADGVTPIPIGDPPSSGFLTQLSFSGLDYLAPLSQGGAISPASGNLRDFCKGKVVMLDRWELWCNPCKLEFPELDDYAEFYEPHGYIQVSMSDDSRPQYSITEIKAWFEDNDIDYCHQYFNSTGNFWDTMGYDYFIPYNILLDKDGYVRKTGGQAFGWNTDIQQLTGGPAMP